MALWGGRFSEGPDDSLRRLNDSLRFDVRLARYDIIGSMAYAKAIQKAGVITEQECGRIRGGLDYVLREFDDGTFQFDPADEDIHTAVERRLTELVGDVGGKLHTGRSRNDQVATDFRLWTLDALGELDNLLITNQYIGTAICIYLFELQCLFGNRTANANGYRLVI